MSFWTPNRIVVFLSFWALIIPFVFIIRLDISLRFSHIYAGLWSYLGSGNPFSDQPLTISPLVAAFSLPFYAPGLASAWLVWYSSKNETITKQRYIEFNAMLILIQAILSTTLALNFGAALCIPTPTTGIVAIIFVSKVVKEIRDPWS
jgi:hypothetical protein